MSDAVFHLFLTASLSFSDPVRDLVRPWKIVRIREAVLLLMGKLLEQPLHIGPYVESVMDGSLPQLTSPPFLALAKSQFFLPITKGFIAPRSQPYAQFVISL